MSTLNGFGTLYYGWHHSADGTATATKLFALSWVPIFPIRRERLRVLTDFKSGQNVKAELGGLAVSQSDKYEILEQLPLSAKEIGITFAKTYLGFPLLLLVPMALLFLLMFVAHQFGAKVEPGTTVFGIYMGGIFVAFANLLYQCVRAIRRARGWQPRV